CLFLLLRLETRSTLFPYTTLFRSIVVGSEVVNSLQKIVSRKVNPLHPAVVTIGVFQAGSAFNVIADTARLEGTVRTFESSCICKDRKSTRLKSSHVKISYAVFCLK